jgi:hypothetical protein
MDMTIIKADFGRSKESLVSGKTADKPISRYQLHVSLAFSEPSIWRRIEVPGELNLLHLHEILQVCFGWTGEHSHQFYVGKIFYSMDSATTDPRFIESSVELHSIEEAMRWCFTYMYDAGDGWEHTLELEEILAPEKNRKPRVLDGEWAAPPEEVGGVHGYNELIHALENPQDEKSHRLLKNKTFRDFEPYTFNINEMNAILAKYNFSK